MEFWRYGLNEKNREGSIERKVKDLINSKTERTLCHFALWFIFVYLNNPDNNVF